MDWSRRHLLPELGDTLRLSVPMMLTRLGQIAMTTGDLALIGRIGEDAMAAALAHSVHFCNFILGIDLVIAVSPVPTQALNVGADFLVGTRRRRPLVFADRLCHAQRSHRRALPTCHSSGSAEMADHSESQESE